MSTILSRYISQENLTENVSNVDDVEDMEVVEAATEAEAARQEAEATGDEVIRANNAVAELDEQNESIEETVEAEGELSPAVAAGYESARRAVVASLGLDPEEGLGEEVIDQPGLESMVVNKGSVALEQNESAKSTIVEAIKRLWEKFLSKAKDFLRWVGRLFDFMDKKYAKSYAALRAMSQEDFDKKMESAKGWFSGIKSEGRSLNTIRAYVNDNGALFDFGKEGSGVLRQVKDVQSKTFAAIEAALNSVAKGQDFNRNQLIEKLSSSLGGTKIEFAGFSFEITNSKGFLWNTNSAKVESRLAKTKELNVTKDNMENALSVGSRFVKEVNRLSVEADKEKSAQADRILNLAKKIENDIKNDSIKDADSSKVTKAKSKALATVLSDAQAANVQVFRLQSQVTKVILDGLKAYLNLANKFTGYKEEAEAKA